MIYQQQFNGPKMQNFWSFNNILAIIGGIIGSGFKITQMNFHFGETFLFGGHFFQDAYNLMPVFAAGVVGGAGGVLGKMLVVWTKNGINELRRHKKRGK